MIIVETKPEHIKEIDFKKNGCIIIGESEACFLSQKDSWTCIYKNEVVCCAGFVPIENNNAECWAIFAEESKRCVTMIVREMKRRIKNCSYKRLEAKVLLDFESAHKLVRILGFEVECERLKKESYDGNDTTLYVVVK